MTRRVLKSPAGGKATVGPTFVVAPYRETYVARPCPCGHRVCKDWHVWPVAAIQGVHFTKQQAEAVAAYLNAND